MTSDVTTGEHQDGVRLDKQDVYGKDTDSKADICCSLCVIQTVEKRMKIRSALHYWQRACLIFIQQFLK